MAIDTYVLAHEPLRIIEQKCVEQTKIYRREGRSDERFCLELFRRALAITGTNTHGMPLYADEEARTLLITIYSQYLRALINRQATHTLSVEDIIQQAWLRFWQAARQGFVFTSLGEALSYLQLVLRATIIMARKEERQHRRDESLSTFLREGEEMQVADAFANLFPQHVRRRFDARCRELIVAPLDRRIFWMRFSEGYAPREIAHRLASEGMLLADKPATARRVSDCIERIFAMLERDPEIRDLLQSD